MNYEIPTPNTDSSNTESSLGRERTAARIEELFETSDREELLRLFITNFWTSTKSCDAPLRDKIFDRISSEIDSADDSAEKAYLANEYEKALRKIISPKAGNDEIIFHTIDLEYILMGITADTGHASYALREPLRKYISDEEANYLASIQAAETLRQDENFLVDTKAENAFMLKGSKMLVPILGELFIVDANDLPEVNTAFKAEGDEITTQIAKIPSARKINVADLLVDPDRQTQPSKKIEAEARKFSYLMHPYIIRGIESDFSIATDDDHYTDIFDETRSASRAKTYLRIRDLSERELFYFVNFLSQKTNKEAESLKMFAQNFGLNGLRTFLATSTNPALGDAILALPERVPVETVQKIFSKYAEIVDAAEQAATYIAGALPHSEKQISATAVYVQLTRHGKQLLEKYCRPDTNASEMDAEMVWEELSHIKSEILLFAATFKAASAEQPITLDQIRGVSIEMMPATELTDEDREAMLRLYETTHQDLPEISRIRETADFKEKLSSPIPRFYVVKHDGVVIGFVRFENREPGTVYAGSFNIDETIQKNGIGEAFFRAVLSKENETSTVEALVNPKKPWLVEHYRETFKFQFPGTTEESNGITYLKMVLPVGSLQRQTLERAA